MKVPNDVFDYFAAGGKPHLRLHYTPTPTHPRSVAHWSVELMHGGPRHPARTRTYQHSTSNDALFAAWTFWWH